MSYGSKNTSNTVYTRISDPFHLVTYYIKMGNYFFDTQYAEPVNYKKKILKFRD